MRMLGMSERVDELEVGMNRAAEHATQPSLLLQAGATGILCNALSQ
jgi:hypothetical protein